MKLLIATGLFPPQVGGPATYSKLLLDKLPGRGFEVRVESFGNVLKYSKIIRHIIYFLKLISGAIRADAVYALDPVSVGLPALVASKVTGKKFYIKIVGDYAWEQGTQRFGVKDLLDEFSKKSDGYVWQVKFLKWVQKSVANSADKILVPSEYLKKVVFNWGVGAGKITVIYNAFDIAEVRNVKRLALNSNGKAVISAGRLVPWKGFGTLIDIWPEVRESMPGVVLYIAGDGPEEEVLKSKVKNLRLEGGVELLGRLKQNELFEYIKGSDLFVLNTAYEGLSHQLLEVMALETPVIATDVGGNPEVIESGESGVLVSYNDKEALKGAIITVLKDRELAQKLVMNAKNRLAKFGEDKMLDCLEAFLKS